MVHEVRRASGGVHRRGRRVHDARRAASTSLTPATGLLAARRSAAAVSVGGADGCRAPKCKRCALRPPSRSARRAGSTCRSRSGRSSRPGSCGCATRLLPSAAAAPPRSTPLPLPSLVVSGQGQHGAVPPRDDPLAPALARGACVPRTDAAQAASMPASGMAAVATELG
eukprot:scaffold5539_cov302-Prasinococcus_capsulatus_cf.AAC.3